MHRFSFVLGRVEEQGVRSGIVCRLFEDRNGVTAIEYGLIASLIAIAAIVMMQSVGTDLSNLFSTIARILNPPLPG